jgi:pimeloyl-ACP methyl ester carboxylesterase
MLRFASALFVALAATTPAAADPLLADFAYPYPVKSFAFRAQGQDLAMAYMDVAPSAPTNGRTVVLLHGKNFCGATWEATIKPLSEAGYRIIAPDQIGFCKSSKPQAYQYSLHQLAASTRDLLTSIGIEKPIIIGHSMGGMLAMRYAVSFPDALSGLVLVNPIGLEDWRAKGVPSRTIDELFAGEMKTTRDRIKGYQLATYYGGVWKPEYDRWGDMLFSMYQGAGGEAVAWSQALTSDMVFSDPVIHDVPLIKVPTVLMIGEKDTTAIGKDRASPEIARQLGRYPVIAREAANRIKGARLITFPELGHSPQVQDTARFNQTLLADVLAKLPSSAQ